MGFESGPFVQAACFCEMVIEDKTGVLSLVRIVDILNHAEAGSDPPKTMPPFSYNLKLALMLKSGRAEGRHELMIVPELPSGETKQSSTFPIHFEGEEKGQNLVLDLLSTFEFEGLYWFRVYLDGENLTSIPLRVRYNPIKTVAGPQPE